MILIKNWNSMTFHDHFCDLSISHDFQGLENENSMTFQVFHDLYEACHSLVQTHILLGLPMNQAPLIWIVLTLASTFLSTLFIAWRIVCTSFPPMPLLELWWPSTPFSWVCLSCLSWTFSVLITVAELCAFGSFIFFGSECLASLFTPFFCSSSTGWFLFFVTHISHLAIGKLSFWQNFTKFCKFVGSESVNSYSFISDLTCTDLYIGDWHMQSHGISAVVRSTKRELNISNLQHWVWFHHTSSGNWPLDWSCDRRPEMTLMARSCTWDRLKRSFTFLFSDGSSIQNSLFYAMPLPLFFTDVTWPTKQVSCLKKCGGATHTTSQVANSKFQ